MTLEEKKIEEIEEKSTEKYKTLFIKYQKEFISLF